MNDANFDQSLTEAMLARERRMTRRQLFGAGGRGLGAMALASLGGRAAAAPGGKQDSLPRKAKRVLCLWQDGGPSHVDLFDPKPVLVARSGQEIPESIRSGTRLSTFTSEQKKLVIKPAIKPFKRYGRCGMELSEMLPGIGSIADEICLIRSVNTEAVNHAPGDTLFFTGAQTPGRPSMGSWLGYGLGLETEDLPAFVVMTSSDASRTCANFFYEQCWGSGFLPSRFQGVRFQNTGVVAPYLQNPAGVSRQERRAMLDDLAALNAAHLTDYGDPEIETRISQYEMAFRMQASVPELLDLSKEPAHVIARYGPDALRRGSFANNCLIARRLLERGTQFVQLMHGGWDQHSHLSTQLPQQCMNTDIPSAALVTDLKERGLMDDTLVLWGGEFGRTAFAEGGGDGRDHFGRAYSMWVAGAGVKPGLVYGSTDDFAWNIAENPVHVHDLQATILHICGLDHEALTYRYQGRQFRLTDVSGSVVNGILS